jgi:hypothetical protein
LPASANHYTVHRNQLLRDWTCQPFSSDQERSVPVRDKQNPSCLTLQRQSRICVNQPHRACLTGHFITRTHIVLPHKAITNDARLAITFRDLLERDTTVVA